MSENPKEDPKPAKKAKAEQSAPLKEKKEKADLKLRVDTTTEYVDEVRGVVSQTSLEKEAAEKAGAEKVAAEKVAAEKAAAEKAAAEKAAAEAAAEKAVAEKAAAEKAAAEAAAEKAAAEKAAAEKVAAKNASDQQDRISKTDLWKGYLDERKQYVDCEFKINQDFDKVMVTWPAGVLAASLTILWHVQSPVLWIGFLFACWVLEGISLGLMLWSMIMSQKAFAKLIRDHDENYQHDLVGEERIPLVNPWNRKTELAEWFSVGFLIVGAICLFVFAVINAPGIKDTTVQKQPQSQPTAQSQHPQPSQTQSPPSQQKPQQPAHQTPPSQPAQLQQKQQPQQPSQQPMQSQQKSN